MVLFYWKIEGIFMKLVLLFAKVVLLTQGLRAASFVGDYKENSQFLSNISSVKQKAERYFKSN